MGTIMYNGTLYSGGGKGLEYWTEDKDGIYNETEDTGYNPAAQITEFTNDKNNHYYNVFNKQTIRFDPSNVNSVNKAKVMASSWCYPCLNDNFEQPTLYDFNWNNTGYGYTVGKPTYTGVSLPPRDIQGYYNQAGCSMPIIANIFDTNKYLSEMFYYKGNEPSSSTLMDNPQYNGDSRAYLGLINLRLYNTQEYGDIAGLQGYNKDYAWYYTWSDIKYFLAQERNKIHIEYLPKYASDNTSYEIARKIRKDIGDERVKDEIQVVDTTYNIQTGHTVVISNLSSYNEITFIGRVKGEPFNVTVSPTDLYTSMELVEEGDLFVKRINDVTLYFSIDSNSTTPSPGYITSIMVGDVEVPDSNFSVQPYTKITMPDDLSQYARIRVVGNASMGDGTFRDYDRSFGISEIGYGDSTVLIMGCLRMGRDTDDISFRFSTSRDETNGNCTVIAIYLYNRDETCQAIYDLCSYPYTDTHTPTQLVSAIDEIMLNSEYAISKKEQLISMNAKYNDINYPYSYQSTESTTKTLTRDHESNYLNMNYVRPYIFKIMCLGKIYETKDKYADYSLYDNIKNLNISLPISGETYHTSDDNDGTMVNYHWEDIKYWGWHIRNEYTLIDHDYDSEIAGDHDKKLYYHYRDRTLARHGIIMDDDNVAWYIYLSPADLYRRNTRDRGDSFTLSQMKVGDENPSKEKYDDKDLAYLDLSETPNHWAYYDGANPQDEIRTYTVTHQNGITFTYKLASLNDASEEKYSNNFINLGKQILSALNLKAVKPYFDLSKMKTGIYVNSTDGTAFSTGKIIDGNESYSEKVNINGESGSIKTLGSLNVGGYINAPNDYINGYNLLENNISLEDKYQQKLIAGENITIEDNVISASGGGGDATHSYTTEPKIVGTWTDNRNVYEMTRFIAKQSSEMPFSWYQRIYLITNLSLPDGHTIDNVDIISLEGSVRDSNYCYPLTYYATSTKYLYTSIHPVLISDKLQLMLNIGKGSGLSIYGYTVTIRFVI